MTDYDDRDYDYRAEKLQQIKERLEAALDKKPVEPPAPTLREAYRQAKRECVNLVEEDAFTSTQLLGDFLVMWRNSRMNQIFSGKISPDEADLLEEYPPQRQPGE